MATKFSVVLPRAGCTAGVVLLIAVLVLSSFLSLMVAATKTPEQLLSEAIVGSENRAVTYIVRTRITLTKQLPEIPNGAKLTIEGSCGAERCVIDGVNRFPIFSAMGSECRVTLRNLKLENALRGALITKCDLAIHKCTFSKNKLGGVTVAYGLSLWSIEDSLFEHNDAAAGAALVVASAGRGRVLRTTFRGNRAIGHEGKGGAVYIQTGGDGVYQIFEKCIFASNSAILGGGAMFVDVMLSNGPGPNPMRVYFKETTFESNVVTASNGGALFLTENGAASFCASSIANKQNRAVEGNDIALLQTNPTGIPISVAFCPEKPAGLSVYSNTPDAGSLITNCTYCRLPTR